jgi:hypothetical protein
VALNHIPDAKKMVEQEQGEPVTFEEWLSKQHGDPEEIGFLQALRIAYISGQDSITTPQQRTWVGLTDGQKQTAAWSNGGFGEGALWAETQLKENNA